MTEQNLTLYGERQEVRELADRITAMLPQVKTIGPAGALALAQVAHSMGLNPFIGEVWAIPQRDRDGRTVGFSLMAGIKGLRRAAKNQAQKLGAIYPYYHPGFRLMSDDEKALADIKPGDKGIVCELEIILPPDHPFYRVNNNARYIVEGVGIFRQGERSKMEPIQVVRKRAESDALKLAFDLPFAEGRGDDDFTAEDNGDWSADVFEAAQPETESKPETSVPTRYTLAPETVLWPDETPAIFDSGDAEPAPQPTPSTNGKASGTSPASLVPTFFENEYSAKAAFKQSKAVNFSQPPERVHAWATLYRGFRDAGMDVEQAAKSADAEIK